MIAAVVDKPTLRIKERQQELGLRWPTRLGSVVTLLTKHLAPKVQAPPAELGVRGDATLQTPDFTDSRNAACLEAIQKAALVVCLDGGLADYEVAWPRQVYKGGPNAEYAANPWWDKPVQVIVGEDGGSALLYDHTAFDGTAMAGVTNHRYDYAYAGGTERLFYRFSDYGKTFVQSCNMSPDGYAQMAMQLAASRCIGTPVMVYGAASTRQFLNGRVDTFHASMGDSLSFCKVFDSPLSSREEKEQIFRKAAERCKQEAVFPSHLKAVVSLVPLVAPVYLASRLGWKTLRVLQQRLRMNQWTRAGSRPRRTGPTQVQSPYARPPVILHSCNMSPDGYAQMAMQLAASRCIGTPVMVYGAASTRQFLNGRVDTFHASMGDSLSFCKVFDSPLSSREEKEQIFRKAAERCKQEAVFPSHLKAVVSLVPLVAPVYLASRLGWKTLRVLQQRLRMNQWTRAGSRPRRTGPTQVQSPYARPPVILHVNLQCDGTSLGDPALPDIYLVMYNIRPESFTFGLSCSKSFPEKNIAKFKDALEQALKELRVCVERPR
ncbi:putative choline O-acetyltransferase [Ixodes scapularis]